MRPGIRAPKQGDQEISARFLQELASGAIAADKINVSYPLTMSKTPHGIVLGCTPTPAGTAGQVCRAQKPEGGTWPSLLDYTVDTGGVQTPYVWDFQLPSLVEYDETLPYQFNYVSQTRWNGSGEWVKAYNLTGQYVQEGSYCLLFETGLPDVQYYFTHYMPPLITGKLIGALNYRSSAIMELDTDWDFGYDKSVNDPPRCWVYDRTLINNYAVPADSQVVACLGQFNGNTVPVWRYVLVQADQCVVGGDDVE